MTHVVILPYYSQAEINRFLRIVYRIKEFGKPKCRAYFLLAASPRIAPCPKLEAACAEILPTKSVQCPTQVFGYPEGPTAMFWDAMDFVRREFNDDGGFSLWLESDMAPVKPDWLDRLHQQWRSVPPPLLMGCYVPHVFKSRLFRRKKLLLSDHVNGGACYAKHFARLMPPEARDGVFDMAVYRYAKKLGRVKRTELIDFSTTRRVRRDVLNPDKVILHGFMQDKDEFIQRCLAPVSEQEKRRAFLHPVLDDWESARRRLRVWFVRRGERAMFENMMLAKQKHSSRKAA